MTNTENKPVILFPFGQIYVTTNADQRLSPEEIAGGISRHLTGDWGDLVPEDAEQNDTALKHGGRLFSAYGTGLQRF